MLPAFELAPVAGGLRSRNFMLVRIGIGFIRGGIFVSEPPAQELGRGFCLRGPVERHTFKTELSQCRKVVC